MQQYFNDKIHIILYDKRTGRIDQSSFISDIHEAPLCCSENQKFLLCGGNFLNHEKYYVDQEKLVLRPVSPARLDGMNLVNVPTNAVVIIDNERYECKEGGVVTLEFSLQKVYSIRVSAWPYLDAEFEIDYSS